MAIGLSSASVISRMTANENEFAFASISSISIAFGPDHVQLTFDGGRKGHKLGPDR